MIMVKANAKINLGLQILGKDSVDGYHLLSMVELPLELHDRIEIYELPEGYDEIITCDDSNVPTDESNQKGRTPNEEISKYNCCFCVSTGVRNEHRTGSVQ